MSQENEVQEPADEQTHETEQEQTLDMKEDEISLPDDNNVELIVDQENQSLEENGNTQVRKTSLRN